MSAVRDEFFGALDKYPQLHPVLHYLRNLPDGVLLEEWLAELQAEQDEFPSRARELAAVRCYLQKAIWDCGDNWFGMAHGSSNYSTLLRQLKRWNEKTNQTVALATFNYDTLLERAYSGAFDVDPAAPTDSGELPGYLTLSSFPILKPHGSVNWGRRIRQADLIFPYGVSGPQNLIARAADIGTVEFFEIMLEAGQVASSKPPGQPSLNRVHTTPGSPSEFRSVSRSGLQAGLIRPRTIHLRTLPMPHSRNTPVRLHARRCNTPVTRAEHP